MKIKYITLLIMGITFSVDYESEIQPIFDNNCGNCHLGNSSGGLNLSTYENLMEGSDDGAVVVPGNHEQSILWDEINTGDMPAGNNPELSDEEIDLIAQWIDEGALPEEAIVVGCTDPNAIKCHDGSPVPYFPACSACNPSEEFEYGGYYGESFYYISTDVDSWSSNESLCEEQGGHLATIGSEEENYSIYEMFDLTQVYNSTAHIGFTDAGDEGNWRWVTNEPVTYTNWRENEPSDSWGGEDYGQLIGDIEDESADGTWNDIRDNSGPDANIAILEIEEEDVYPCENYYNSLATVDNGLCMYDIVPTNEEFTIDYVDSTPGFQLDWSDFVPPVEINKYVVQRCLDPDGDTDGDGELEYENCILIVSPVLNFLETSFFDEYDGDITSLKYTLYVHYPNNLGWSSAFGYYYYIEEQCNLGDITGDGLLNVLDIVNLVNYIFGMGDFTDEQLCSADLNTDGIINVLDIVNLVNLILS